MYKKDNTNLNKNNTFLNRMEESAKEMVGIVNVWDECDASPFVVRSDIPYFNKIGKSPMAYKYLENTIKNKNGIFLIASETGSGKTNSIINILKTTNNDCINIFTLPSVVQVSQTFEEFKVFDEKSKHYDIKRLLGGDLLGFKDFDNYKIIISVYDKIFEINKIIEENPEVFEGKKINLIWDEAHLGFQDKKFRSKCISEIFKLIENIKNNKVNGSVYFMTASFETLLPLQFDEIITFYNLEGKKQNYTNIIVKDAQASEDNFILKNLMYDLKHGYKLYVRLNNKELAHRIVEKIQVERAKQGNKEKLKAFFLNSDEKKELTLREKQKLQEKRERVTYLSDVDKEGFYEQITINDFNLTLESFEDNIDAIERDEKGDNQEAKTYKNVVLDRLIKESILPDFDILFTTSMVDAGFNIKNVENVDTNKIVFYYVVNSKNINIDCIEQSAARLRFPYKNKNILLSDSEKASEQQTLEEIIKNEYEILKEMKEAYTSMYNTFKRLYSQEKAKELIKNTLSYICKDESLSASNLYFDEENDCITYDKVNFYRYCRENIYMKQFLNPELLKEQIKRVFGDAVYIVQDEAAAFFEKDLSIMKEKDDERMLFFENILNNKDDYEEEIEGFFNKDGRIYKKYENSVLVENFEILTREHSKEECFKMLSNTSKQDLTNLAKEINKKEVLQCEEEEKQVIVNHILKDVLDDSTRPTEVNEKLVGYVLNGKCRQDLETLIKIGYDRDKAFELVGTKTNEEIKNEILTFQTLQVNKFYKDGYKPTGKFEKEQYSFIKNVELLKKGQKTLTIKKGSESMELMKANLVIDLKLKKRFSDNYIFEVLTRTYKYKSIKNKDGKVVGYVLHDLK